MTKLGISWLDKIENERHNMAEETERVRSNMASESLKSAELEEQRRHNTTEEAEILRHNQQVENENLRAHMADESIRRSQIAEQSRHNWVDEQNKAAQNFITQQYYTSQIKVKEQEAAAKTISAKASRTTANAKKTEVGLKQEMLPYEKWESTSRTLNNTTSAVGNLVGMFP